MKKAILAIGIAVVVLTTVIGVALNYSYENQDVNLRVAIDARVEGSKSHYTKMFEILVNKAGVAKQYEKAYKEIYPDMIKGRYSQGGGQLMQWVQEHNPSFDTSLFKDLMVSIEGQRESFHNNQLQLIDLKRQHDLLLKSYPSKWFLQEKELYDISKFVIINDQAAKAFETGREQKMNLFE